MEEMKGRCILNDTIISKYKFPSPAKESPPKSKSKSNVNRSLFREETKIIQSLPKVQTTSTVTSSGYQYDEEVESLLGATASTGDPWASEDIVVQHAEISQVEVKPKGFEVVAMDQPFPENSDEEIVDDPDEVLEDQDSNPEDETAARRELHEEQEIDHVEDAGVHQGDVVQPDQNLKKSKKYYCPFCRQLFSKFARHLFQTHDGETQVKEILQFSTKNPERLRLIAALRAEGARIFNNLQTSPSKLILARQKQGIQREQYIACYMCGNMYKNKFLHRHIKRCPNAQGPPAINPLRLAKIASFKVPEESSGNEIILLRDVISGIREGEIKHEITKDYLIKEYGSYLCSLYGTDKHLVNLIRRKLRQVAEVLLEVKKLDTTITQLQDIFITTKKTVLFTAIKNVTGFQGGSYKRPAMANEMSTLLQHCAKRLLSKLLESNEIQKTKDVRRWIELMRADYNAIISKHARKSLDEKKWNKPKTLPLTEDLIKLNNHVKHTIDTAITSLKTEFNYVAWENLNKGTMIKTLIFNRKRVGDVQRIRVEDFKKAHNVQRDSITYNLLTESERLTCAKYMRVEVRGKHAKVVPMLLTEDLMDAVKLIISIREEANIPASNPYVFAKKGDDTFQASIALRQFAYNCGALNPKLLTGTRLRQEIATATQAFNFSENDLAILANFLGHTLQTHREFYRLPDEAIHLAKISKVLEIVDSGRAAELKGKSLSELDDIVAKMIEETPDVDQDEHEVDEVSVVRRANTGSPKKKRTVIRRTWTTPEKRIMRNYFKHHLYNRTLPTPDECKDAKIKFSPIRTRTVEQIKAWVNNYNKKMQKQKK